MKSFRKSKDRWIGGCWERWQKVKRYNYHHRKKQPQIHAYPFEIKHNEKQQIIVILI